MTEEPLSTSQRVTTTALSRSYTVPFSEVWDLVLGTIDQLRGWQLLSADSHEGTMRVLTLSPFRHRPMEAAIRLWLDELGLTRLEIRYDEPRHILLPPVAPQRGEKFLKRIDRALTKRRSG
jgi:hypothetical protein